MKRRTSRRLIAAAVVSIGSAVAVAPASAASIVGLDVGAPKAGIATTLKLRTIVDQTSTYVAVRVRATGGPPCAPTSGTDPGTRIWETNFLTVGDTTESKVYTFTSAGSFQWCAWMIQGGAAVATSTGTFAVASPVGAITGVVAPPAAPRDRNFVVTVSGSTEVERYLIWRLRPGGEGPCAASPSLDPGTGSFNYSNDEFTGAFQVPITLRVTKYGRYRLCSWVATGTSDIAALGVNETPINVPAPPVTSVRVGVSPGVSPRARPFVVTAVVSSRGGAPSGRCAFDRRVGRGWQPYTTVSFRPNQACRAKIFAGRLGPNRFRVRYLPGASGFAKSAGLSRTVIATR